MPGDDLASASISRYDTGNIGLGSPGRKTRKKIVQKLREEHVGCALPKERFRVTTLEGKLDSACSRNGRPPSLPPGGPWIPKG